MDMQRLQERGLVMLGCGKMGSAMLEGWLEAGLPATATWVVDPFPSDWLKDQGVHINEELPENPAVVLIAVKPQMMQEALPTLAAMGNGDTVFVSVAAGVTLAHFAQVLGAKTPIIRAMPNTPAAIKQGITAIIGNANATAGDLDLAEALLGAIGAVVRLDSEAQIDAVTGLSGSGPAYVFHLIETMTQAGVAEGLAPDLAQQLAIATVAGAGALAASASEDPTQLRINVTSPNGTTQAGLEVLMNDETGFPKLVPAAVAAAVARSKELANG